MLRKKKQHTVDLRLKSRPIINDKVRLVETPVCLSCQESVKLKFKCARNVLQYTFDFVASVIKRDVRNTVIAKLFSHLFKGKMIRIYISVLYYSFKDILSRIMMLNPHANIPISSRV